MKKILSILLCCILTFASISMTPQIDVNAATLIWPVPGYTQIGITGFHNGNAIDIIGGNIEGAPVVAAMGGTVKNVFPCVENHHYSGDCNGFGTGVVILGDDNRFYQYAHMYPNSIPSNVYVGAYVSAGTTIGAVGNTGWSDGAHLHFGISKGAYYNESGINPANETYYYLDLNQPPFNPTITKNQNWYDLGDTVEIRAFANNTINYYMSMFKDGVQIINGQYVDAGVFTMPANTFGTGGYRAYFSCVNNVGYVDTQSVEFSVVGVAEYTNVYASNDWYDLTDTVSISVDTKFAKGQTIGIDKVGTGRIITKDSATTFTVPASELGVGKYSAYFTVYNNSGFTDTKTVSFVIVDKPSDNAVVSTTKTEYALNDIVNISVSVNYAKGQTIGIDKSGTGRMVTETCNPTFTIPACDLGVGEYSAYFTVFNNSGGYDTKRVYFSIVDPSVDKPTENEFLLGDINLDRTISIIDATQLQLYLAQLSTLTPQQKQLADTDKDNNVSIMDATRIQLFIAKLIEKF